MKTALICVSFGTSVAAARESITAVENALRAQLPQADFFTAFTSKTIRRKLAASGEKIPSLEEVLEKTAGQYDLVLVQPTHFLYGIEYDSLCRCIADFQSRFAALKLGEPLLARTQDLQDLAQVLSERYPMEPGRCLVLMGHGTLHQANVVYPAFQTVLNLMGRPDMLVGTVEEWPALPEVCGQLKEKDCSRVTLLPLMLVAGDHALNDMAGEEADSWKSILTAQGYQVECIMQGLGVESGVQALYCQHLQDLL